MKVSVNSPLPGKLLEYPIKRGDIVAKGDVVAIVESMKMHNEICSEVDGVVITLVAFPDQYIPVNGELVRLETNE